MVQDSRARWRLLLVIGLIQILLGIVTVMLPGLVAFALFNVIGWVLLLAGTFQLFQLLALDLRVWEQVSSSLVLAIFYCLVGLFIVLYPQATTQLIGTILSLFFFIGGLVKLFMSLQLRPAFYWQWLFFTGVVGLLLSAYLFVSPAGLSAVFLGILIGFYLALHGASLVFYSVGLRAMSE